jgi:excisionase family DNA binding protein
MHRSLQFGMRENPASDGRHGSRSATSTELSSHFIEEENPKQQSADAFVARIPADAIFSAPAAANQAATAGKSGAPGESTSTSGRPEQAPVGASLHTRIEFEPLLDVIDAAKLLRIHPKTLRGKAARGIIPAIQIGRVWRFRASMLNRWLEGMTDRGRR